ncbi:4'-phosphopantetheinyl transferase family protein [Pseudarthrobacter sp. NPDC092439]|uniref:4'-phosphopantetheinyl transferase family protein n=1 Tax=unclassified Pseudarthrobacter TaxID=2647000 RepID=UPI00381CE9C3
MSQLVVRAVPPFLLPGDGGSYGELDPAEVQRAGAMEPAAATRFLASRLAQRRFAAGLLGLPSGALAVLYSCPRCGDGPEVGHGRPGYAYRGSRLPLALSLSRAGGWTLLAAVPEAGDAVRLGVDIEDPARTGFPGFADVALTAAEQRGLHGLAAGEVPAAQARLWARKEAWLKMTGEGLRTPPAELDVRALPGLRDLDPGESGLPAHLAAAVAISG